MKELEKQNTNIQSVLEKYSLKIPKLDNINNIKLESNSQRKVNLINGHSKEELENADKVLTKEEYMKGLNEVLDQVISSYEMSKSTSSVGSALEVMVLGDEVWLLREDIMNPSEVAD